MLILQDAHWLCPWTYTGCSVLPHIGHGAWQLGVGCRSLGSAAGCSMARMVAPASAASLGAVVPRTARRTTRTGIETYHARRDLPAQLAAIAVS